MKLDNFRLIVEVARRQALWDSTMQACLRKDMCRVLWPEVADIMQLDVEACKKRFKGLRDSYRAEVRKIQKRHIDHSNWPYFRSLEFLRSIFDPDRLVPFSPVPFDVNELIIPETELNNSSRFDDFIVDVDNDDSFDFDVMGDIFKRDSTDANGDEENCDMSASKMSIPLNRSESPRLLTPLPIASPTKRSRRRRASSPADFPYATPAKMTTPVTSSDLAKDDPDYNFLVSLLPHIKTLSSMNNMKFRTEVSRMLMDLNQQERESNQPRIMHKQIQRSSTNHIYHREPEPNKYNNMSSPNGNSNMVNSSIIECDVKIENEQLEC